MAGIFQEHKDTTMSTQDDDKQSLGVMWAVLIGAVLLAISLAIGFGLYRSSLFSLHAMPGQQAGNDAGMGAIAHQHHMQGDASANANTGNVASDTMSSPAVEPAAAIASDDGAAIRVENGIVKFYFASGSAELAPGAAEALADVVKGVATGQTAVISGYHDTTGNAALNEELSKKRAFAVRDALAALGVSEDKLELRKPEVAAAGSGNNAEARRVEVRLE